MPAPPSPGRDLPRPFVKWAGGKRQILEAVRENLPKGLGRRKYVQYAEPFLGGGAVLLDTLPGRRFRRVYVGDTNRELVAAWRVVRDDVKALAGRLEGLEADYQPLGPEAREKYYYARRDEFNALKATGPDASPLEVASLLIFLNKTCFNGLYRVNGKGLFNVPVGLYKNPKICDRLNLARVSAALKGVEVEVADYAASFELIDERTFVYLDPPYRPLTATSSFTAYTEGGFDDDAQRRLAAFYASIAAKGAAVLLSNSDPGQAPGGDDFLDRLYQGFKIVRLRARRHLSSDGDTRGQVGEILVRSY